MTTVRDVGATAYTDVALRDAINDEGIRLAKEHGTWLSMDIYNTEYTQEEGPKTR